MDDHWEDFGPTISLTTRIREVLAEYGAGLPPLLELLQVMPGPGRHARYNPFCLTAFESLHAFAQSSNPCAALYACMHTVCASAAYAWQIERVQLHRMLMMLEQAHAASCSTGERTQLVTGSMLCICCLFQAYHHFQWVPWHAESLAYDKLAPFQGPSLVVFNDGTFSADDFLSISQIGESIKRTQEGKTGQACR